MCHLPSTSHIAHRTCHPCNSCASGTTVCLRVSLFRIDERDDVRTCDMLREIKPHIVSKANSNNSTMKISPSTERTKKPEPLLPLQDDPELYRLDKTNSVSWDLLTDPADANSAKYRFQARILQGNETARQMIRWKLDVEKVCEGLNVTTVATRQPIMEAMMRQGPKSSLRQAMRFLTNRAYQQALEAAADADALAGGGTTAARDAVTAAGTAPLITVDMLDQALGLVVVNLLPRKILAKVKRSMRRDMRKPPDMKVREYYHNLQRLNEEELPNLPPYGTGQNLTHDEMLDIVLFGTPRSWQNKMERQDFDPMEKTLQEVVNFMENLESLEPPKEEHKAKAIVPKKENKSSGKKKPTHFCKEHGPNFFITTPMTVAP